MPQENTISPGLFGLIHSNRDFNKPQHWGKNVFNNAFPAALACYMYQKGLKPIYIKLNGKGGLDKDNIGVDEFFGMDPLSEHIFFAFESTFSLYQPFVVGALPRTDLVIMNKLSQQVLRPIEIKLTALPDNSTSNLPEDKFGCEIVVRPDTIVYLALSICEIFRSRRQELDDLFKTFQVQNIDWTEPREILPKIPEMVDILKNLMFENLDFQHPLVMQPIWKSQGKLLRLHENAFDIFIWSNFAFTRLFFRSVSDSNKGISRPARSVVWLFKMLMEFAYSEQINPGDIFKRMSYNVKNDKAFSVAGRVTQKFMISPELITPRIGRAEIKNIILGNGQELLSPERRLDAAIQSTVELWTENANN
jgi:hypothetical protein